MTRRRLLTRTAERHIHQKEFQADIERLYSRVFSSDEGQVVLDDIVHRICRVDDEIEGSDALQTYRALGRRAVGLKILNILKGKQTNA